MMDINNFKKIEPINKGLSNDKKYYVESAEGERMFLRVFDITDYERRKTEYEMMERTYNFAEVTPKLMGFGNEYSLCKWIDGEDVESLLPQLSDNERYKLGFKSGEVLRKIHSVPITEMVEDWDIRFERKVQKYINKCDNSVITDYLTDNKSVLDSCTQTFIHGDYNTENIILQSNGELKIIDFNCYNNIIGEPWWDLCNMNWMPKMYPQFHTGQIHGYFNVEPPIEFWKIFTYYQAYDALAAYVDSYGLNGIEESTDIVNNILRWTNNLKKRTDLVRRIQSTNVLIIHKVLEVIVILCYTTHIMIGVILCTEML